MLHLSNRWSKWQEGTRAHVCDVIPNGCQPVSHAGQGVPKRLHAVCHGIPPANQKGHSPAAEHTGTHTLLHWHCWGRSWRWQPCCRCWHSLPPCASLDVPVTPLWSLASGCSEERHCKGEWIEHVRHRRNPCCALSAGCALISPGTTPAHLQEQPPLAAVLIAAPADHSKPTVGACTSAAIVAAGNSTKQQTKQCILEVKVVPCQYQRRK